MISRLLSLLPFWRRRPARPASQSPDAGRFRRGSRCLADLIAPAAVQLGAEHLALERQLVRTLALTGLPRSVTAGWLRPLLDLGEPLELSLHLVPLASHAMVAALTHRLVALHSSRLLADRRGKLADPERETAVADLERLREALQRGIERLFSVGCYVAVRADTAAELEGRSRRVERTLAAMLAQSRPASFEQDRGFHTCLPEGQDQLGVVHNMDTSSLATTFPFTVPPLFAQDGVLYGVTTDSHAPVVVDPFDERLDNANLAIFATSGAGKSYFTKLLLLRTLVRGVEAVVIDPEDEYRPLCRAVDGQVVRLAGSAGERLNPFDLPGTHGDIVAVGTCLPPAAAREDRAAGDPLDERIAALVGLVELLVAEPGQHLGVAERAVLDRALYATYAQAGILRGQPATYPRPAPLLGDLAATLQGYKAPLPQGLAGRLARYVDGSLAGLFAGPTTVHLERPLVVFSLQALEPELRPLGIHLISGFIWSQVRRQRRPRLLVIDEAWTLLQHAEGARFLGAMARRARKYHLGLVTITQDVADALDSPQGRIVLTTAASTLLLKQSAATIAPLVQAFNLSDAERRHLLAAGKGEGILSYLGARVPLRVLASPKEHALVTTAPRELAAREQATPGAAVEGEERA